MAEYKFEENAADDAPQQQEQDLDQGPVLQNAAPTGPQKSGCSKLAVGCGIGCTAMFVVLIIAGIVGWNYLVGMLDDQVQPFVEQGYEKAETTLIGENIVQERITQKTVYNATLLDIKNGADVDIAIFSLARCKLAGEFKEVTCNAHVLVIEPGCKIEKLSGYISVLVNLGTVEQKTATVDLETSTLPSDEEILKYRFNPRHLEAQEFVPPASGDKSVGDKTEPAPAP